MKKIGLIAAIRQEIQPVLKRFPAAERAQIDSLTAWRFDLGGKTAPLGNNPDGLKSGPAAILVGECRARCIIIESGIGTANASRATSAILGSFKPDIILNIGFCGALKAGTTTGDLVLAEQLFLHTNGSLQLQTGLQLPPENALLRLSAKLAPYKGTFITTENMASKESVASLLGKELSTPVLEMESAAVFRICKNAGIQFAALRSVSDAVHEDPFSLFNDIIGPNFCLDKKRVLVALMKKPGYLPQLMRLTRNAQLAGESLADAVICLMESLSCE